jgi:hypothetical protein
MCMVAGFALPFVIVFGCDDTTGPSSSIVFPDVNVSYSEHVQPLFNQTCTFSGCHDDVTRQSDLSLTSYVNATQRLDVINPGNPNGSSLYLRVEGIIGPQMPKDRSPLNRNQRDGIYIWIDEGAQDN